MQAESDHHVRDTYNYVTVQTDMKMPQRCIRQLQDAQQHAAFEQAIHLAVQQLEALDMDTRVLNLGAGAGVSAASSSIQAYAIANSA